MCLLWHSIASHGAELLWERNATWHSLINSGSNAIIFCKIFSSGHKISGGNFGLKFSLDLPHIFWVKSYKYNAAFGVFILILSLKHSTFDKYFRYFRQRKPAIHSWQFTASALDGQITQLNTVLNNVGCKKNLNLTIWNHDLKTKMCNLSTLASQALLTLTLLKKWLKMAWNDHLCVFV